MEFGILIPGILLPEKSQKECSLIKSRFLFKKSVYLIRKNVLSYLEYLSIYQILTLFAKCFIKGCISSESCQFSDMLDSIQASFTRDQCCSVPLGSVPL